MLAAGASVPVAMESALAHLPAGIRPRASQAMHACLAAGQPISAALVATQLFPADQLRLVALAERSGHVDILLRDLADFADEMIALRRIVVSGLALPAVYLVIAAFLGPLPALVAGGSLAGYLGSSLGFLSLIGLGVGGALVAWRRAPGTLLDRALRPLPLLGTTWRELDYWQLTRTLALLSRTSVGIIDAVRLAADTCRSPRLATVLCAAADQAEARGVALSPLLRATGELPPEMVALWQTGEQSGRLDETFQRLATLFAERCRHRLAELARWTPRIGYLLVAAFLVYKILSLARGYIDSLNTIMGS
jgi:general secretion pathway protein F